MRDWRAWFGLVCALLLALPAAPLQADDLTARTLVRTFATGHRVAEPFLSFFERYGLESTFGQPVTEAFEENGRLVQYFQRARLEFRPEYPADQRVQLANLGDALGGEPEPPIAPDLVPPSAAYFAETGHSVDGDFLDFIGLRGGARVFGFPTTEPYLENGRLVQRFQRAILELWLEHAAAQRVQPRLLGDEYLARRYPNGVARLDATGPEGATAGLALWSDAEESAEGYLPEKVRNVARSLEWLDGRTIEPGETFKFSSVLERGGYELGLCYGAYGEYHWCDAGGACSGASTFYRAWVNAGLEVVYRRSHTVLPGNPQLYGQDAAIDTPGPDLIVRNNAGPRLRIIAKTSWAAPSFYVGIAADQPPPWNVAVEGPIRDGPLTYRMIYRKLFLDGRREERTVTTSYDYPPPATIPAKPLDPEPAMKW